jgi:hypothetical protein
VLDGAITKSGAKNPIAVKSLLDLEALRASKNQAEDIKMALNEVKTSDDYLFTSDEPFKNSVKDTNTPPPDSGDDLMRKVMGLSPKE